MKKLLLFLLLIAASAQAETYRWTDKDGTIHFTDSPGAVPGAYRKSAEAVGGEGKEPAAKAGTSSAAPASSAPSPSAVAPRVEGLKERMMNDSGIMGLISALQGDPEMQAVLNDPAIMSAVQSGNISVLLNNPTFMKLLNNPNVQEIQKKLQQGERK